MELVARGGEVKSYETEFFRLVALIKNQQINFH